MERSPYHRFCRGIEFFLLSAWECKKGRRARQTEKGLMLLLPPLLLPPWNVQRRDISREAHLAPWSPQLLQKTEFCNVSLAILQSPVHKWAKCRMRGGEKEIYEAASAHFNNEAAFSIFHPSILRVGRVSERTSWRAFSPLITRVFIILLIRRSLTSANLHLNQGLLWRRRRRRRRREPNNRPTN